MSAANLRSVGNRGVWIDPDAVIAVAAYRSEVAVLLAGGERVVVTRVHEMSMATRADVERVLDELADPSPFDRPGSREWPIADPAATWDERERAAEPRSLTVWCSSCFPSRPCFAHETPHPPPADPEAELARAFGEHPDA